IGLSIPPNSTYTSALCPETTTGTPPNQVETMTPLSTNPTLNGTSNLNAGTGVTVSAVNQVVTGTAPTTASTTTAAPIAFITYSASSTVAAQLPYYLQQTSGIGPLVSVKLPTLPRPRPRRRPSPARYRPITPSSLSTTRPTTRSTSSAFPPTS